MSPLVEVSCKMENILVPYAVLAIYVAESHHIVGKVQDGTVSQKTGRT